MSSATVAALAAWMGGVSTPAFAQDPGIAPKTDERVPRPGTVLLGNPADPPKTASNTAGTITPGVPQSKNSIPPGYKLDPKLEKLLTEWEKRSHDVKYLNGTYRLFTYDEVFQSESRAIGKFWYATPDKGRMDFYPADVSKLPRNSAGVAINEGKRGANKQPFTVVPRTEEKWICNGSEILQLFPEKREYNRVVIPKQYQGESIKESPLPFLFGLRKTEAQERYLMELGSMNETYFGASKIPIYHVKALPLREQDIREWSRAEVLLDARSFLPISIRTFDPAGTSENVYTFHDIEVNKTWLLDNPFNESLLGYKLILDKSTQPQMGSSVPGGQAPKPPVGKLPLK
ncbi:MAG TPA: hypothetical protein VM452_19115 [Caulifigura sp.]|nr:hypothetical protein [Caulifigura sp.]